MVDRSLAGPSDADGFGRRFDAVVVGAGFAGMYMLLRLRNMGMTVRVYEAAPTVGGTWYWNRYPGARCDAESVEYSYAFSNELQQDWTWTERFATQPEILRYAEHVAERFDLKRDIVFDTRVKRARFDESKGVWRVETNQGDAVKATFFVMATGPLSAARLPDFPGLADFRGHWYHTHNWPAEQVDFTGKRVGVIGTGSTGIQCIPIIAQQAEYLHVFQRTANFSVPARNAPLSSEYLQGVKARYPEIRELARWRGLGLHERGKQSAFDVSDEERVQIYEGHWENGGPTFMHAFADLITNKEANDTAVKFVHGKIREIVKDAQTAELLMPRDHPLGAKRICVDTDYYATFNRENVELVDVRSAPIEAILPTGLKTSEASYDLDIIVFATGFDALTGSITKVDIEGIRGKRLKDNWGAGPVNYLSFGVADFPNMFMIAGPGSPGVLANVVMVIEQHVEWIAGMLEHMRENRYSWVDVDPESETQWVQHVNDVAAKTLLLQANSWYLGAKVPGKPRVFMPYAGGIGAFRQRCVDVASNGYSGFLFKA